MDGRPDDVRRVRGPTVTTPDPSPELFDELEAEAAEAEQHGEIIIVGTEECPNCGAVKTLFEEELEEGSARYIDIDTEEGRKIDTLFGKIKAVPFVTYHDKPKNRYTECDLLSEGDTMEEAVWTIACDVQNEEKNRVMPVG